MIVVLLIVLGLCFGSFVNALVWRLHEHRNFVNERSECTHCHHVLAPKDLVPVVSWLLLRGKCRYCRKPIQDTPVAELLVPALWVVSYVYWPHALYSSLGLFTFVGWLLFVVGFVALAIYDFKWFLLPDKIVFPLIGLAAAQVLASWLVFRQPWHDVLPGAGLGVLVLSGFFYVLYVLSRGTWIGFGDVKLGVVLGLLAGGTLRALLVLFVASFVGMLIAVPLLLAGKMSRKSHLPFGPLLLVGMFVVELWGTHILDAYIRLVAP